MGQVRNTLGEDKQSTVIAALPLYHVFALTVNCLGFFRFGAHNVLVTNPRDMPGFIKTLKATRPDGLILVSTLAGALLDTPGFADVDLSGCRITVAGGMAVRSSVAERWRATTGADIIEGYGLTEASPVVSVNPTHMPPRIGTIGVPLPSTDVKILDDDSQDRAARLSWRTRGQGTTGHAGILEQARRDRRSVSPTTAGFLPATSPS